jgi:hypothetical protein
MAPIFVPLSMLLGDSPELTQVAYRIGDSTTNIISPTMSCFALVVAFATRYDKSAGISIVRRRLVVWADFLVTRSQPVGEIRYTPLQSLDPVGEEANHLVESTDGLILERYSALELRDSVFHRQIVVADSGHTASLTRTRLPRKPESGQLPRL